MYYGTLFGGIWCVMYIMMFAGVNDFLALVSGCSLFMASPVFAALFALKFRKDELGNLIPYSQAWRFIFIMYICATLLSTGVNYVYFTYIDNGTFISSVQNMITALQNEPMSDAAIRTLLDKYSEMVSRIDTGNFAWQLMDSNITNTLLLPPIIALFVRKNK